MEQLLNLKDIIRSRRSISMFKDQPVPLELVEELLESAVYAPNHRMTEPWRFIVLTGEARGRYANIRAEMVLDKMKTEKEADRQQAVEGTIRKFAGVPLYLLVVMKQNENPEVREEDYAACSCVIQNFMLLAWERGLGTCWKTFKNDPRLRAFVGLSTDEQVVGIVHVGYPDEEGREVLRQSPQQRLTVLNKES